MPLIRGYLAPGPNAQVQGVLRGDKLELRCSNSFVLDSINKPEVLQLAARKATAILGRQIQAVAVDKTKAISDGMDHFLQFGRQHPDFVNIK